MTESVSAESSSLETREEAKITLDEWIPRGGIIYWRGSRKKLTDDEVSRLKVYLNDFIVL